MEEEITNKVEMGFPGYTHPGSVAPYTLEDLGSNFEIYLPPENLIMAICIRHEALRLMTEGYQVEIVTLGGAAEENMKIIKRMNELTQEEIPVVANTLSNSLASNISSLADEEYNGCSFVIFCQEFTKKRTKRHAEYHLAGRDYELIDWESYESKTDFTDFETDLLKDLLEISGIPNMRKFTEWFLLQLARFDPENGGTLWIANLRARLRSKDPRKNIFTKTHLD